MAALSGVPLCRFFGRAEWMGCCGQEDLHTKGAAPHPGPSLFKAVEGTKIIMYLVGLSVS